MAPTRKEDHYVELPFEARFVWTLSYDVVTRLTKYGSSPGELIQFFETKCDMDYQDVIVFLRRTGDDVMLLSTCCDGTPTGRAELRRLCDRFRYMNEASGKDA